jgi:hypothetical protein
VAASAVLLDHFETPENASVYARVQKSASRDGGIRLAGSYAAAVQFDAALCAPSRSRSDGVAGL